MSAAGEAIKVLSVVGSGRSGTTVLASILGEIEGFTSAGELRWLWARGLVEGRPCGCGAAPSRCKLWAPVVESTLAAVRPRTLEDILASQRELARRHNLPRLLRTIGGGHDDWPALRLLREVNMSVCTGLTDVTGSRVVIDTSKRPLDAAVFAGLGGVDHYVLHLVRDPHAVVHSWRRAKTFSTAGQTRTMGTRRLPSTVRRWTANCRDAEALRRRIPSTRWLHLRYEDFAAEPRPAVERILELLGESSRAPFVDDNTVLLHTNHIVAGNPSRFTTGSVSIELDDGWRRQMPRHDRFLVDIATIPFLLRYGYAGRPRAMSAGPFDFFSVTGRWRS